MLLTYRDLFTYFLDGIKKTYTGTVHPNVFARIFNEWAMLQWTAENVSMKEGIEMTQKQIDDLQSLLVSTEVNRITNNTIDLTTLTPKYRRLGNMMVKVNYDSMICDTCGRTGLSEWLPVRIMRIDHKTYIKKSVFRKPSENSIYYKHIGDNLIFDTGDRIDVVKALIEYFKYPSEMAPMVMTDIATWNNTQYTDIDTEQKKEVLDLCVKIYLERVKDERYKSFLNEQYINQVQKI
jgi:hypothetical protein